jgi:hypothetical protein
MKAIVEKAGKNSFTCRMEKSYSKCLAIGYGSTAKEAMEDFSDVCAEFYEETGDKHFLNPEVTYVFDIATMFSTQKYLSIEGVASIAGIKPSVLRQYASGVRKPKSETVQLVQKALQSLATQLNSVVLT